MALAFLLLATMTFVAFRESAIHSARERLTTVGRSKMMQITGWLTERKGDVQVISRSPLLAQSLRSLSEKGERSDLDSDAAHAVREYLRLIKQSYQYGELSLLKPDGSFWISSEDPRPGICEEARKLSTNLSPDLKSPLYVSVCPNLGAAPKMHQDLLFPIVALKSGFPVPIAHIALRIDPSQYLFPLLKEWPSESETAETLLLSQTDGQISVLAELKLHEDAGHHPRLKATTAMDSMFSLLLAGLEGFRLNRDQNGTPVYSYSQKIEGTPWILVVKQDESEILDGVLTRTLLVTGGLLLVLLTAFGLVRIRLQKEDHRQLRESEENFRGMISRMQDAFFRTSFETGRILYCNPHAVEMLGFDSENELIGQQMQDWLFFRDWDRQQFLEKLERNGEIPSHINTLKNKQGKFVPVDAYIWLVRDEAGKPQFIESLSRNATARYKMEQELRQEKDKAQTYLDVAGVMIMAIDSNQKVTMLNRKCSEILGYEESEILGKNWFDHFKRGDSTDAKARFDAIFKNAAAPWTEFPEQFEGEAPTKTGKTRLISWHSSILQDAKGAPTGLLLSGEDITDKKSMELKLLDAMYEAKAATAAKTDFLANMSHEIRTPLNAIMGLVSFCRRSATDLTQLDFLRKSSQASESLLGIINDILDFSKVEAGKIELENVPFDLVMVFQRVSDLTSFRAEEKGLSIDFHIDSEVPPYLKGDPLRLNQILLNLTTNAIKFSEDGKISVQARLLKKNDSKAQIEFSVRDSGIGMNQEQQEKLFQSFSQTDHSISRKYGGTGLGLAICKRLTDIMGGEISVSSHLGIGSVFSFRIPFTISSESELKAATQMDENPGNRPLSDASVLVVEDNEINQLVAQDVLEQLGARVGVVSSGEEALRLLKESPTRFQLVLMDLQMPGLDGYQTTLRIRQELALANLPVIAMTAHVLSAEKAKCFEIGMNDYISKPIDPMALQNVLQKWIPGFDPSAEEWAQAVIDHDQALHRFAGRKAFYIRLLNLFVTSYKDGATQIAEKIKKQEWADASLLAHSLRGAAGNISAMQVFSVATELEDALDSQQRERSESLLRPLAEALEKTMQEIALYTQGSGHQSGIPTSPQATAYRAT